MSSASIISEPIERESAAFYPASIDQLESKLVENQGKSEFARRMHSVIPLASYNERELALQIDQNMAGFIEVNNEGENSENMPKETLMLLDIFWDKDKDFLFDSFATGNYHDRTATQVLLAVNPKNPRAVSVVFVEKTGKGSNSQNIVTIVDFADPRDTPIQQSDSGITLFPFDTLDNDIRDIKNTSLLPKELGITQQGTRMIACVRTYTIYWEGFANTDSNQGIAPAAIHMNPLMEIPPQNDKIKLERYYEALAVG